MEKITLYIKESYNELVNKVSWPTWPELQSTTVLVIVGTIILTLIIAALDFVSGELIMKQIYKLL